MEPSRTVTAGERRRFVLNTRVHVPLRRPMVLAVSCLLFASRSATVQQPIAPPLQRSWDPPGEIVLNVDGSIAEGSLPVGFVRSPDTSGPGGDGRYLIAVNSGYGVQVDAKGNVGQQLLQVIDLNAHAGSERSVYPHMFASAGPARDRERSTSAAGMTARLSSWIRDGGVSFGASPWGRIRRQS